MRVSHSKVVMTYKMATAQYEAKQGSGPLPRLHTSEAGPEERYYRFPSAAQRWEHQRGISGLSDITEHCAMAQKLANSPLLSSFSGYGRNPVIPTHLEIREPSPEKKVGEQNCL